ncbi:LOW QUALITY PROTEIN: organic cation transporter protein-like [Homalodisca vitripennis]|uniref:LOW QUALITY PROTEIN: organic cation transporter protein-like n=1 Tax=Homalodisca vitripennis TaxID=197043 RepID=UPI001EEBC679|nr:LOW QUALITY PROTEIN: organic cation transporter protein-like [Homalodisca vitripennis]
MSSKEHDDRKIWKEEEFAEMAMGGCGRWQVTILLLLSVIKLPVAWTQLGIAFLAAPVTFHCSGSNLTCTTEAGDPCNSWRYDRSVFPETIISEWDLVCSRSQLVNITQMVLMIGLLIGNFVFSIAADMFGRKLPLVVSGVLQMLTGCCASFAPWFSAFLVLRFLQAVATGGAMTIGFVMCMEILSGKWRTTVTTLSHIPFNIGHEIMVPIAYFTRHWRLFQLATSLPSALIITYLWLVPESPRWLLAVGRHKEAVEVLRQAAASNNIQIPEDVCFLKSEKELMDMGEKKPTILDLLRTPNMRKKTLAMCFNWMARGLCFLDSVDIQLCFVRWTWEKKPTILDLLRTPNMRKKTLAMCFNWMACGLCFLGLAHYVSTVNGNIFINVAIGGMFVIPGMIITLFTLDRVGRRATLVGGNLLASVSCFLIIVFHEAPGKSDLPRVVLVSLGILGMGISFPTAYLYSGELFPTVVRNSGIGSCSMCARIGSMVAPFAASLGTYNSALSPLTFGTVPLVAAILTALLLPETKGCQLPQTLEEGELFGSKSTDNVHKENVGGFRNDAFQSDIQT